MLLGFYNLYMEILHRDIEHLWLQLQDNHQGCGVNQELSAALPHGGGFDINLFGPLSLGARVMNNYLSLHPDNQYLEAHAFISWSQILDP